MSFRYDVAVTVRLYRDSATIVSDNRFKAGITSLQLKILALVPHSFSQVSTHAVMGVNR